MRYLCLCLLLLPFTLLAQTPIPSASQTAAKPQVKEEIALSTDEGGTTNDEKRMGATKPFEKKIEAEKKIFDKKFYTLMFGLQASTMLDIESSYHTLKNCPAGFTCREGNPLLRPFVQAGRPAVYAFTTGTNALAVLSSYKLKKNGSRFWWVPMTVYTGIHAYCAVRNFQTVRR